MIFLNNSNYKIYVVIAAAGQSTRMGTKINKNKIYLNLNNNPVLYYSLKKFISLEFIDNIVVVISKNDSDIAEFNLILKKFKNEKKIFYTFGGETRTQSIYNGIKKIDEVNLDNNLNSIIIIHDGARPNFPEYIIKDAILDLINSSNVNLAGISFALELVDTICKVNDNKIIIGYENRNFLYRLVTPQIFYFNVLKLCFEKLQDQLIDKSNFTDETSVLFHFGYKVKIFDTSNLDFNLKITKFNDINLLEKLINDK